MANILSKRHKIYYQPEETRNASLPPIRPLAIQQFSIMPPLNYYFSNFPQFSIISLNFFLSLSSFIFLLLYFINFFD